MKKFIVLTSLLGAAIAAQSANAIGSSTNDYYYSGTPAKASYTITLSGECSAKITKTVTTVSYGSEYDYNGNVIDRGTSDTSVNFYTDDNNINAYGESHSYIPGDKHSETVKNGTRSFKATFKHGIGTSIFALSDGSYNDEIKCTGGQTLEQLLTATGNIWTPYINPDNLKASVSLVHTNSTSAPDTGEYKAKLSATSIIELPGQCTVKGTLLSADYGVVCAAPKSIKIKVVASAEGVSALSL